MADQLRGLVHVVIMLGGIGRSVSFDLSLSLFRPLSFLLHQSLALSLGHESRLVQHKRSQSVAHLTAWYPKRLFLLLLALGKQLLERNRRSTAVCGHEPRAIVDPGHRPVLFSAMTFDPLEVDG